MTYDWHCDRSTYFKMTLQSHSITYFESRPDFGVVKCGLFVYVPHGKKIRFNLYKTDLHWTLGITILKIGYFYGVWTEIRWWNNERIISFSILILTHPNALSTFTNDSYCAYEIFAYSSDDVSSMTWVIFNK